MYEVSATVRPGALVTPGLVYLFAHGAGQRILVTETDHPAVWRWKTKVEFSPQ
jgi:hypothetical protein